MYYGAMSGFDMVACALATYYLLDFTASSMSTFARKVLRHGMIYAFGTTLSNVIVLMAVCHVKYIEKLGAFLSVAVTMIMSQHLVLSTQSIESGKHRPTSLVRSPRGHGRGGYGTDTFELGVRVQTETHMETDGHLVSARAVELQRAESLSSTTGASAKGFPGQYDLERGDDKYEEDARQYALDAKPPQ
ncbi:hypothetical protein FRC06_006694 [Ceratobasidium sp. 370]|nr:hypothetical protein FRC06_006694 [Ceratobasidium sp. 370]